VQRWTASGLKLDMGKSCVRFRALEQVSLEAIGDAIAQTSVQRHIAAYERSRG